MPIQITGVEGKNSGVILIKVFDMVTACVRQRTDYQNGYI